MVKTTTLKISDARSLVLNKRDEYLSKAAPLALEAAKLFPPQDLVLYYSYFKDGRNRYSTYCQHCHEVEDLDFLPSRYSIYNRQSHKCPKCGNNNYGELQRWNSSIHNGITVVVEETPNYLMLANVPIFFTSKVDEDEINEDLLHGSFEFMKNPVKTFTDNSRIFFVILSKSFGFRAYENGGNFIAGNANDSWTRIYKVFNSSFSEKDTETIKAFLKKNFSYKEGDSLNEAFSQIKDLFKKPKKAPQKKVIEEMNYDKYIHFVGEPVEEKSVFEKVEIPMILRIGKIGLQSTYQYYCNTCHKSFKLTTPQDAFECPECHAPISRDINSGTNVSRTRTIIKYELMSQTNDLVLRLFESKQVLNAEGELSFSLKEELRIFYGENKVMTFRKKAYAPYNWEKVSCIVIDQFVRDEYIEGEPLLIQTDEELVDVISKSNVKYSGIIEAWGLNPKAYNPKELEPVGRYARKGFLYQWYQKPYIEKFIKVGLRELTLEIIDPSFNRFTEVAIKDNFFLEENEICKILNCNMEVFRIARKLNLGCVNINYLRRAWTVDHHITAENFRKILESKDVNRYLEIAETYKIPFARIQEYLECCYNNQCIEFQETLMQWNDYLRMARTLGYNLSEKNLRFPSSLKKEHDRALFAYKVCMDRDIQERFVKQAEINQQYAYADKDFIVKVPNTPEEIVEEGNALKHCVRIYVNNVREGSTVIAFIRKATDPDESYFTIEIKNHAIVQFRGFSNCLPTDKKLLTFAKKYASAKNLISEYPY